MKLVNCQGPGGTEPSEAALQMIRLPSVSLVKVAVDAADAIGIPVTGIDLMVPSVQGDEYVFIEANERPGLANHEPRPTAQAFVDLLFPRTAATPWAWQPGPVEQG